MYFSLCVYRVHTYRVILNWLHWLDNLKICRINTSRKMHDDLNISKYLIYPIYPSICVWPPRGLEQPGQCEDPGWAWKGFNKWPIPVAHLWLAIASISTYMYTYVHMYMYHDIWNQPIKFYRHHHSSSYQTPMNGCWFPALSGCLHRTATGKCTWIPSAAAARGHLGRRSSWLKVQSSGQKTHELAVIFSNG